MLFQILTNGSKCGQKRTLRVRHVVPNASAPVVFKGGEMVPRYIRLSMHQLQRCIQRKKSRVTWNVPLFPPAKLCWTWPMFFWKEPHVKLWSSWYVISLAQFKKAQCLPTVFTPWQFLTHPEERKKKRKRKETNSTKAKHFCHNLTTNQKNKSCYCSKDIVKLQSPDYIQRETFSPKYQWLKQAF